LDDNTSSQEIPGAVREYLSGLGKKDGKIGCKSTNEKKVAAVRENGKVLSKIIAKLHDIVLSPGQAGQC